MRAPRQHLLQRVQQYAMQQLKPRLTHARGVSGLLPMARVGAMLLCAVSVGCVPTTGKVPAPAEPVAAVVPVRAPWIASTPAAAARSEGEALSRLQQLADVWHAARWFHPDLIDRAAAWDTAYLRHVDAIRATTDEANFAEAMSALLREIGDAETRVVRDTVMSERMAPPAPSSFAGALVTPVRRSLRRGIGEGMRALDGLTGAPADTGAQPGCCATWTLHSGPVIRGTGHRDSVAVQSIRIGDQSVIPAAMFALHQAGAVRFVSAETGVLHSDAAAVHIKLGDNAYARIRIEELLLADGRSIATRADSVAGTASTVATAPPRGTASRLGVSQGESHGHTSAEPYPSLAERLLAVTKLWGTVRALNPYLPMADESWDDMFARAIGEVEEASSARAYSVAMARFVASLDASQASIVVPDHPEFGAREGRVPFQIRLVDRRAIVSEISEATAAQLSVFRGDEIVAIGGEPIDKRLDRLREYVSASNAWSREQLLEQWLLSGPAGAVSTFRVQPASGGASNIELRYEPREVAEAPRVLREVQTLANGVVRVRLGAMAQNEDAALPGAVATASAVIVDARGVHSAESLRWLAGSLLDADSRAYARDDVSEIVAPPRGALRSPELDPARQFTRTERRTGAVRGELFSGPMAILVDASTRGDGELLVLRLAAGAGRRVVVGSTTAGAVGQTATLSLPGGVQATYPVSDVRYPDGRFVQRLGVAPGILVEPTVAGVRSGRDEVLEAAQRWITQQLAPSAPIRRRE